MKNNPYDSSRKVGDLTLDCDEEYEMDITCENVTGILSIGRYTDEDDGHIDNRWVIRRYTFKPDIFAIDGVDDV